MVLDAKAGEDGATIYFQPPFLLSSGLTFSLSPLVAFLRHCVFSFYLFTFCSLRPRHAMAEVIGGVILPAYIGGMGFSGVCFMTET